MMMLAAISITLGWWLIPTIITIILLAIIFRPIEYSGGYFGGGLEAMFRCFWFIPMFVVWIIYLVICLVCK